MNTLMAGGTHVRPIEASGNGEVKRHTLTATLTGSDDLILVSVDHSQSAPINEIDETIQWNPVIQSFGNEGGAGPLQVSTDIETLTDVGEENPYTVEIASTSTPLVAGEEAEMAITVTSSQNIYSPMIEIPLAGFSFDNESEITENGNIGTFEVLNSSTGGDQLALFIQSVGWTAVEHPTTYTYLFNITPANHGELDLDLRIRPLYDDTNVFLTNKTFTVMGRGNVTVNVVNETGAPVDAASITLGTNTVLDRSSHTFTGVLNGTYTLAVNGTGDYPSIRTTVRVTPDATALYNVTLPSSLSEPTLVFSEGGVGSIAGVAQVPPDSLNAARNETTTYNVTVLGNGGELGIALEFPMRYLMNTPVVRVNGVETAYELINGTFEYNVEEQTYSTTNATLIVYNTIAGSNTIEIEFDGGKLGKARSSGEVTTTDALFILQIAIGLERPWDTYDYIDVVDRDSRKITTTDALYVLQQAIGEIRDEYYNLL
jgi:hypothetical protein